MRSLATVAVLLALAGALAACGESPSSHARPVGSWSTSKPNPVVGQLRAGVLDRPLGSVARVVAEWQALPQVRNCALEIVLPDGVELLEGARLANLPADALEGDAEWLVGFPLDRTLDATLRLCADTDQGQRACEVSVRLVTVRK